MPDRPFQIGDRVRVGASPVVGEVVALDKGGAVVWVIWPNSPLKAISPKRPGKSRVASGYARESLSLVED